MAVICFWLSYDGPILPRSWGKPNTKHGITKVWREVQWKTGYVQTCKIHCKKIILWSCKSCFARKYLHEKMSYLIEWVTCHVMWIFVKFTSSFWVKIVLLPICFSYIFNMRKIHKCAMNFCSAQCIPQRNAPPWFIFWLAFQDWTKMLNNCSLQQTYNILMTFYR